VASDGLFPTPAHPRPLGRDNQSPRIEAHADEILALIDEMPGTTLAEIAANLERSGSVQNLSHI